MHMMSRSAVSNNELSCRLQALAIEGQTAAAAPGRFWKTQIR